MYELFKRSIGGNGQLNEKLVNPFLYLNLKCPPASYDANVEPAKDDVLFHHEDQVFETCEAFFSAIYGQSCPGTVAPDRTGFEPTQRFGALLRERSKSESNDITSAGPLDVARKATSIRATKTQADKPASTSLGMMQEISNPTSIATSINLNSPISPSSTPLHKEQDLVDRENVRWQRSMYQSMEYFSPVESESSIAGDDTSEEDVGENAIVSNPWTIAKMNAPLRKKPHNPEDTETARFNGQLLTPQKLGDPNSSPIKATHERNILAPRHVNQLPSPVKEYASPHCHGFNAPSPPRLSCLKSSDHEAARWRRELIMPALRQQDIRQSPNDGLEGHDRNGTLDRWMQKPTHDTATSSPKTLSHGLSLSDIPSVAQRPRRAPATSHRSQQSALSRPFVSPVRKNETNLSQSAIYNDERASTSIRPSSQLGATSQLYPRSLRAGLPKTIQKSREGPQPLNRHSAGPGAHHALPSKPTGNLWLAQELSLFNNNTSHFDRPSPGLHQAFARRPALRPPTSPPQLTSLS